LAGKTLDDYVEDLDIFVSENIKKIPYDRLPVWKEMLFNPLQTIKNETKNASLVRGAKDVAVSSLAYFIIVSLYMAVYMGLMFGLMLIPLVLTNKGGLGACLAPLAIAVLIVIAIFIALVVLTVIGWLVHTGIEYAIARLLGGNGEYTVHAYLGALSNSAILTAFVPLMALYLIPCLVICVGVIVQPVMMALGLYSIYIRYLIVKQVHNLTRNKAIAVVLIPIIVDAALVIIFYFGIFLIDIAAQGFKAATSG